MCAPNALFVAACVHKAKHTHLINYAQILPQDVATFIYTASPLSTGQGILGFACTLGPLGCSMIVQSEAYSPHTPMIMPKSHPKMRGSVLSVQVYFLV